MAATVDSALPTKSSKPPVKPDKSALDRAVGELNLKIDRLKSRSSDLKNQITGSSEDKSKLAAQRKEIRDKIDALRVEQNTHNDARQKVFDQLKHAQESLKNKVDDIRKSKDKLNFKSTSDIERRIKDLEAQVSSGMMKLTDEKRALQDITALRKQKKALEVLDSQDEALAGDKKTIDDLRQKLDTFEPERKRIKAAMDELFSSLRALDLDKNETGSSTKSIKSLIEQREAISKEINDLIQQRRELYAENKRQNDEWYQYQREEKARKAEQYRMEKAEREKQKKLESIKFAREQAEIPAFEAEINTCNALVSILRQMRGETGKVEQLLPAPVSSVALPENTPGGTVVLKKKSDRLEDEHYLFGGNQKKKGGSSRPSTASNGHIKLDLAVVEQFWSLKLDAPVKFSDIENSLKNLEEKKKFYLENQEQATKENMLKAEELEAKVLKSLEGNEAKEVVGA